jgi:hypothetical protein
MVGVFISVPDDRVVGVGECVGLYPVPPAGVSASFSDDSCDLVRRPEIPLDPLMFWRKKF